MDVAVHGVVKGVPTINHINALLHKQVSIWVWIYPSQLQ